MKFKDLRKNINEAHEVASEIMMPNLLVLRRMGVRMFPDGKKVALYVNQRYNLMFSVPYGGTPPGDAPELRPNPVGVHI